MWKLVMQNIHVLTGVSVAELKHHEQKEVRGKELFKLIAYMFIIGESQGRNWSRSHGGMLLFRLLSLTCST